MTNSGRMNWAGHVVAMERIRNLHKKLIKISEDTSWKMYANGITMFISSLNNFSVN
jgi:hypothetical protein